MKKSCLLLFTICCLLSVFLWGCGGGAPGAPGSSGAENTGVILEGAITPTYNGQNTASVDVIQQVCGDPAATPVVYEYMADHGATLTVNAKLLNPNTKVQPGTLYIEKYTVEFRRSTDSIGTPPIETDIRYETIVITPPTTGVSSTTVTTTGLVLVDLIRKSRYFTDVSSGQYTTSILNNYTATYTFEGKNQYGDKFSFVVQTPFQIGSFDNCA